MNKLKIFGYFLLCTIVFKMIGIVGDYTTYCPSDFYKANLLPVKYQALVIDKFIDNKDRSGSYKIKLKNYNNDTIVHYLAYVTEHDYEWNGYLGLWDKVEIGDSIFKPKNSLDIVLKKGFYDSTFFKYNCNPKNISNW